ncbi:hypothetical protein NMG60_11004194 [Bertholletia excelsa]
MEEDQQELKHVCKFCNKSFPCGRSLGGHMRSHVINSPELADKILCRKKLLQSSNNANYGLRENPKKTCRFADSNEEDALLQDKLCKECGKGFQSWKALFGHMKCHSERFSSNNSLEEADSSYCQSDNEAMVPNRRKRSKRVTRYMATTTSSSFSIANNNASSSVSEIEQEQEEVAMCLMMLSRDVGNSNKASSGFNSVDESSDNNFELLEAGSSLPSSTKSFKAEALKFKQLRNNGKLEPANLDSNSQENGVSPSGFSRNGYKQSKSYGRLDGFFPTDKIKMSKVEDGGVLEACEVEYGKNLKMEGGLEQAEFSSKKFKLTPNRRQVHDLMNPESSHGGAWDTELGKGSEKRSKFECTTCNKTFHSYQALGGHRASHKKIKGCFASKIDGSENRIETDVSPDQATENKLIIKTLINEEPMEQEVAEKKIKAHECPICLKVFSSGQALGGHKRSHLIGAPDQAKPSNQTVVSQKPNIPEIRDLLDLNLPAPVEEEIGENVGFKPWWGTSNHKHEPLLGLLSN